MEPSARIRELHAQAEAREEPGYLDPHTGLFVMTAAALRAQGHCCGKGCRHCPWPLEEQARAGRPGAQDALGRRR